VSWSRASAHATAPVRPRRAKLALRIALPRDAETAEVSRDGGVVRLNHLRQVVFPAAGFTKRDLLQYYADIATVLLPYVADRPLMAARHPDGTTGPTRRLPAHRPAWLPTCEVARRAGRFVALPMAQDVASLLWLVNVGCIDFRPWAARCDDVEHPDTLCFALEPLAPAIFAHACEAALFLHQGLERLGLQSVAKTSGRKGLHVAVPIARGPRYKQVWQVGRAIAHAIERANPRLVTADVRPDHRPRGRVVLDYDQNIRGRGLAAAYSVRSTSCATVSTPLRWSELGGSLDAEDFRLDTVVARVQAVGDLWRPMLASRGRSRLGSLR
jgi:bifunctional non-homologous end joining protein LigD